MAGRDRVTTTGGAPIAPNPNTITAGVRAKGSGAHGALVTNAYISNDAKATTLQKSAKTTMIARLSAVADGMGGVDAARDVRGFAD